MSARPQRSKGKRPPLRERVAQLEPKYGYCGLCGEAVHNQGAHFEKCRGRDATTVDTALRQVAADHPAVCQARRPTGFNAYTYCLLPWAHSGEHIYFADPESRRT